MEIVNIPIIGWCNGVNCIFNNVKKIVKDNPNTKFYCFKELVHNKASNQILKQYKIKIITSLSAIKDKKNSIVLLQAHGTTQELINKLKKNRINYVDLTCKFIKFNESKLLKKQQEGYKTYFIGNPNHQETIATASKFKSTEIIDIFSWKKTKFLKNKKSFITNQTTLNSDKIFEIKNSLKSSNILFDNGCCPEILLRQKNLKKVVKDIDLLIVIGDNNSNNAIELTNIAKANNTKFYLINTPTKITKKLLKGYTKIGVCTSASAPKSLYEKIYKKLVSIAN